MCKIGVFMKKPKKEKDLKINSTTNFKSSILFSIILLIMIAGEIVLFQFTDNKKILNDGNPPFIQVINLLAFVLIILFIIRIVLLNRYYKKSYETDPITNQINFDVFQKKVKRAIKHNPHKTFYIYSMRIPNFQTLNEIFGYVRCNIILAEISKQLSRYFVNMFEYHCRLYSNHFVFFSPRDLSKDDTFIDYMSKNISDIKLPGENKIVLSVQIGACEIQKNRYDNDDIYPFIGNANLALENIGHSDLCIATYDDELKQFLTRKALLEQKMYKALENEEFKVYLQPKHRTSNEKLVGCEALVRWQEPEMGLMFPDQFIEIFEKNRFIYNLDFFVLEKVCSILHKRRSLNKPVVPISVNISPVDLDFTDFVDKCIALKEKYDIPDKTIELEFTETTFVGNKEKAKEVMKKLHENGFELSIDDFGKEYSSLNLILDLPIDTIKLDASFFSSIKNLSIVRNIVAMARALGIITIAEGVETLETLDFLKMIGCNIVQGYYFSKPMPCDDFEDYIVKNDIDKYNNFDNDYDKLIEIAPTDLPIDQVLDETYIFILHINLEDGSFRLHPRKSNSSLNKLNSKFAGVDELCDYFCETLVFEDDRSRVRELINLESLREHFKYNGELIIPFRYLDDFGLYSGAYFQLFRSRSEKGQNIKLLGYMRELDNDEFSETLAFSNTLSPNYSPIRNQKKFYCSFDINLNTEKIKILENKIFKKGTYNETTLDNYTISYNFIKNNLVSKNSLVFMDLLSIDNLKQIDEDKDEILDYIINFKLNIDSDVYIPFRVLAKKETKDDAEHVIMTIEKADEKIRTLNTNTLLELQTDLLSEKYDSFVVVNITKDVYFYSTFDNLDEKNIDKLVAGKYSSISELRLKKLFMKEDYQLIKSLYSLEALDSLFDNPEISLFSNETLMKPICEKNNDNKYKWTEIYTICAKRKNENGDKVVALYFRNTESEHKIDEIFTDKNNNLYNVYSIFDFILCYNLETNATANFLGGNYVPSDYLKKDLDLSFVKDFIFEQVINEDSKQKFLNDTSYRVLKKNFENRQNYHCMFNGKKPGQTVDFEYAYDRQNNKVFVYIKTYENTEM